VDTKKKSLIASERDEAARVAFRAMSAVWETTNLTFIDESGTQTNMTPRYSRAPRGERAYGSAPRNHEKNTTLIASLSRTGLAAAMTLEGALDGDAFAAYLAKFLIPTLVPGQIVVMDNLSVHKLDFSQSGDIGEGLSEACEEGARDFHHFTLVT